MRAPNRRAAFGSSLTLALALILSLISIPAANAVPAEPRLSTLALSVGTLTPAFDPSVTTYSATVPYGTNTITLTSATDEDGAALSIWNGVGWSYTTATTGASTSAVLPVGATTLSVMVTSADTAHFTQYAVTVTREPMPAPAQDPRLSSLAVSAGTLSPAFDPAHTSYNVDVPYETTSFTITAASPDPSVVITNFGRGTTGPTSTLTVGGNLIQVRVTAADNTVRDYMLFVNRAALPPTNVDLTGITLSVGTLTPTFDPTVTSYTVAVPYAVRSMQIGATLSNTDNTLRVNNVPITSGATTPVNINFDPIGSSFDVRVTAPNSIEKGYTVTVVRDQPSDNADLTALSLSDGTLSPSFANATGAYTATVPYLTTSVQVTGTLADSTAILRVNGNDVVSGTASAPVSLRVGTTSIVVSATAEDGVTETIRTVAVTREAPILDLDVFDVAGQSLAPAFDAGTLAYTLEVPYLTSSIDVTATAVEAAWDVVINGVSGTTAAIALPVGDTTVAVTVTALHGESRTYTAVVTRLPAPAAQIDLTLGSGAGDLAGGSRVLLAAENLLPGSIATLTMFSSPVLLGTGTVLGDATLAMDVRLPASVPAGAHRLVFDGTALDGSTVSATVWFTVMRDGTIGAISLTGPLTYSEAAPASTGSLPSTGAEGTGALAALALLLAAAGVLMVRTGRARRIGA